MDPGAAVLEIKLFVVSCRKGFLASQRYCALSERGGRGLNLIIECIRSEDYDTIFQITSNEPSLIINHFFSAVQFRIVFLGLF